MTAPEKAFVNSFWGRKDDGFAAVQMRIKASLRTLHELLDFYKQKIEIEKEYNKRLGKLASSVTLGSGEMGSLKLALDKLQIENRNMIQQNQAYIRSVSLENYEKLHQFYQIYHKNATKVESHMQKVFQKKHDYAMYLDNAKEKYRVACGQQKTLTLLCQTTWGKELEKNTAKLHKVQQNLQSHQNNYQQAVRKYAEIHEVWVRDWSISLTNIYQLEIERIQVCKLNCFAFCNHVASLCVEWDSAVDHARSAFAKVGAPRDVHDFVDGYGTGSQIPVPPNYVDFLSGFDDEEPTFTIADFKDPDYSQILSRTFSTHSTIVGVNPENASQRPPHDHVNPVTPSKPVNKTLPPIKESLAPNQAREAVVHDSIIPKESNLAEKPSPNTSSVVPNGHLNVRPNLQAVPLNTGVKLGVNLQKQPSHNSNYTSGAEDRHEVFDRMHNSNSSDYSSPTNYSNHTGRSWSSPRKKSAQEVQREINRRSQDLSELYGSPKRVKDERRKSVPLSKDFSIDFIAKALEDLNAGGDGDMNKFRRSVRRESNVQETSDHAPASDFVDDSSETAKRFDSITFRSPGRNSVTAKSPKSPAFVTDEASLNTVVKNPSSNPKRRSLSQSPTKSYTNLQSFVDHVTPVTRNTYVTKAMAKYSYTAREQGELTFKKGWHMFVIHKQEDNWYVCELGENCGENRGSVGLVPYNYVVEGEKVF
ncbi:hypothetical protein OXX79_003047 [Metschnikowia pulcherrima]